MASIDTAADAPGRAFPTKMGRSRIWNLAAWTIAFAVAFPILAVFSSLFAAKGDIWRHLAQTVLSSYVANSLLLVAGVGIGVLLIGVPAAWMVTLCRFPGRKIFDWALLLPMAMPAYVIAYTYTGLLDYAGPAQTALRDVLGMEGGLRWLPDIRSLPGAVVMLVLVLYPYVYLLARAAFLEQSACVLEVSRTLGCSPWRGFFHVALPLARPALVAGVALALMEALNDFGTVQYFGVDTLATGIYRVWRGMGDAVAGSQLAALLLVIVFLLLAIERGSRGSRSFAHTTTRYRPLPRYRLKGLRAAGAIVGCALPVSFGFLLPASVLIYWAITNLDAWVGEKFLVLIRNSFFMAGFAAALAVCLASVLAYATRLHPTRPTRWAVRVASLGYAIPGPVLAIGILLPFAAIDHGINAWARATFGVTFGLILSGTLVAVTFAYLVRFLTVSLNVVETSLGKVTRSMDFAARSLGRSPFGTLRDVHLPIMRGSLLTAGIVVFVDVLKELPATLVLRPFNFDTLATMTYNLASDERLAEAAGPALAIVAVGILPVYLMARASAKARPGQTAPAIETFTS
ncbi:ABC transporter permease [Dongia rigui]|uniref:Iron ABC transporter permease n=1 Tax=Dongia rigui TaxID=940149 RepID=A0ABU5E1C3_9PROT|nr:iron ABC transporter permease [Dongia rigui]MDY0873309.1 iron ABC transporter permease [Dongia rigui]